MYREVFKQKFHEQKKQKILGITFSKIKKSSVSEYSLYHKAFRYIPDSYLKSKLKSYTF